MNTEKMFCYQCSETALGSGCILKGVCGKDAQTAGAQDKLIQRLKLLSVAFNSQERNPEDLKKVGHFVCDALFTTITNANFDAENIQYRVADTEKLIAEYGGKIHEGRIGVLEEENEDRRSLIELVIYGLKGMSAYAEHAARLGFEDLTIYQFVLDSLCKTLDETVSQEELLSLVLQTGEYGVKTMALLDQANTETYGHPEITEVNIGVGTRPGILISGHDLSDMEQLLEQTEGTGVDVYTHSEMLPANYYPKFKKYKHFIGNYGNAWWQQREEFASFRGPILFTTNCIVPPLKSSTYADKVFITNATGYPGFKYIPAREDGTKDFSEIIALAKTCPAPIEIEHGSIVGGFAHNQVLSLADKIVENIQNGSIRKFVVMGGCDGRVSKRNYYKEFAEQLPQDTIILTAGCAKYRYNKLNLGTINGIPRVLDAGQCNDSYSLAVIALKLKEVMGLQDINDLPIAFNIAWYEQKAVIVLLALLYLGVKNIHLGPVLPAFLSPNVAKVLVENFGISPISDVESDLEKLVG